MPQAPPTAGAPQPVIVLVEPQLGENIGAAARAMANFGLTDLRLVNPREGWPNDKARAAASRADHVIDRVRVFTAPTEAVEDLSFVFAATARAREVAKTVVGPREAAAKARMILTARTAVGVVFGRERTGLTNEEVSLADEILTLPVEADFPSLNMAQSVLIVAYEWRLSGLADEAGGLPFDGDLAPQAPKAELMHLFAHLEAVLDEAGFFRPPEKRQHMVLALRAMLQRARLSDQEVRTLRGVVAALERRPTRPHPLADGTVTTERGGA